MISRSRRLRIRRVFRRRRRQVEDIGSIADQHLDRHFFRRLMRLVDVRRFVFAWVGLILLLVIAVIMQTQAMSGKYQETVASPGGFYTEGIVGSFTNLNPIYATGSVDSSVSNLVFAGLLKYDDNHKLINDLAESWDFNEQTDTYAFVLKPDLKWHDGKPLTAEDVVFTYRTIQNADARSYLQTSWQGIEVSSKDSRTVTFTLPNKLSSFPHSLTTGIIPKHILGEVSAEQMRSSNFNTIAPVGSGPFKFEDLEVSRSSADGQRNEWIALSPFSSYHGGEPKIRRFAIQTFSSEQEMIKSYQGKQITSMIGLTSAPDQLRDDSNTLEFNVPLLGEVLVFFKTSEGILKETEVRRALVLAANRSETLATLPYSMAVADEPLLHAHLGYDRKYAQKTGDLKKAQQMLDKAGWKVDPETGLRSKGSQNLIIRLYSQSNSEYAAITQSLQKQWREAGVDLEVILQSEQDLQSTVSLHNYDALLYAVSLGPDPDVFAYWHSSQADLRSQSRLNFSEYNSMTADMALEGGRTRSDPAIRKIKYEPFLKAWQQDAPALALYQPRFLYVVRAPLHGFDVKSAVTAADRYTNVHNWMIREDRKSNYADSPW